MSSGRRVGKGLASLISGRLASAAISVASTAVLARLLTPADFGVIAAAFVVLALGNVIFEGAFGVNLVRRPSLRPEDVPTTLTAAVLLGLALAAIVIALAPLVEDFFDFPGLATILVWCSATIPLKAVTAIGGAVLQREGRFAGIAVASIGGQLAGYVLLAIPLAFWGASVWALVVAMLVAGLVEAVWLAMLAKVGLRLAWHRETLKDIGSGSLFSAANVLNWAANTSANAIVGGALSAVDLGLYSRGWKLLDLFVAATSSPLSRVLLPFFAAQASDPSRLKTSFLSVLNIVLPAYAAASALFILQAPLIVNLALGSQWGATVPVVQCLFAALVPRCAYKVSEVFAVANGRSTATFVRQGAYAALMVLSGLIGVGYGINGVAFGISIAITLFYVMSMSYATSIAAVSVAAVLLAHVRAAIMFGLVGAVDLCILFLTPALPQSMSHGLAGLSGILIALIAVAVAPAFFLGPQGGAFYRTQIDKIFGNQALRGRP